MSDGEARSRPRTQWAAGDLPDLAQAVVEVAEVLVDVAAIEPELDLLDVGTGTGNVAIPAAQRGARVTGLDITPELFESARARASEAGVEIEWIEGDAEELPFAEASFDRVLSSFGAMFAPDHAAAAAELARVCRPGGTIAFTAWTPQGVNGQMFRTIGKYMPRPPAGFQPPILWGNEDHVRELLGDRVADLRFERRTVPIEAESADAWTGYIERTLGPVVLTKAALEQEGKWEAARTDLSPSTSSSTRQATARSTRRRSTC
jgi:ubiquinone/menaquinone biosynthesis C-methylase UbiE